MTEQIFIQQLSQMPEGMKQELLAYFDYLLFKYQVQSLAKAPRLSNPMEKRTQLHRSAPKAGFLKGTFVMASDFDAPLDDFKDYMP